MKFKEENITKEERHMFSRDIGKLLKMEYMSKEEKYKILNTIKLFIVYGGKVFYNNYYHKGKQYIQTDIPNSEIQKIIYNTGNAEKEFNRGLIPIEVLYLELLKYAVLTRVVDFEKLKLGDNVCLTLFKQIANSIIGNFRGIFYVVDEITENENIPEDTILGVEANTYADISKLCNNLFLQMESVRKGVLKC